MLQEVEQHCSQKRNLTLMTKDSKQPINGDWALADLVKTGSDSLLPASSLGIVSNRCPVALLRSALLLSGRTSHGKRNCSNRPCKEQKQSVHVNHRFPLQADNSMIVLLQSMKFTWS